MNPNHHPLPKLLVILGPTASGKSDLAIELAQKFNGEIVSADSRQVYQKMDIGTGKVPRDNNNSKFYVSKGIRHHLLNVASPKNYFSVAQYQKLALKAIKDILKRKKLPILCGGTGLYLSSIIEGWVFPKVKPNLKLRKQWESKSPDALFQQLQRISPQRAKTIDNHNKRRLVRALEIILENKTILPLAKKPLPMAILILGIKKDREELKQLILKRLEKRLKEGMVEEVQTLKEKGVSSKRLEDFGLEYRWVNRYLEKQIDYQTMQKNLFQDIVKYAKRQMTWFTNQIFAKQKLEGFKIPPKKYWVQNNNEAVDLVRQFLAN